MTESLLIRIDSFYLEEYLVLLTEDARRLHILNPVARLIWQLQADGLSNQQVAKEISATFDVSIDCALADINLTNIGGQTGMPASKLGAELVKQSLSSIWKQAKKEQTKILKDQVEDKVKDKVKEKLGGLLNKLNG